MNDLPLFPIPSSGETSVSPLSRDVFSLNCFGINTADRDAIARFFFIRMQGRYGAFRFQFEGTELPECRFEEDTGQETRGNIGPHNLGVLIKILRRA